MRIVALRCRRTKRVRLESLCGSNLRLISCIPLSALCVAMKMVLIT